MIVFKKRFPWIRVHRLTKRPEVRSLLDSMENDREYSSLLNVAPTNLNLTNELRRAIADIQAIRQRPLICYVGNVLRAGDKYTSIEPSDDLPFAELIAAVPATQTAVDILIATPGGSGQQVSSFVQKLRPRFTDVAFIVPHMCMSAGTIWAMSGNDILMDERGFLGPIDPQVRNREGYFVPAQAIFTLLAKIQDQGQKAITAGHNPQWTDLQLLKIIDPKELGNAIAGTDYAVKLVREYLINYKFANWTLHSSTGQPVTPVERQARADEIAKMLSSHEQWKTHSHGIFRDVLWQQCKLKINHPDQALTRSIRRLWTAFYWSFENTPIQKIFISSQYSLFKSKPAGTKI